MSKTPTIVVHPGDLPRRIVLLQREGNVVRETAYLLRVTRSGGLLLNKDELHQPKAA